MTAHALTHAHPDHQGSSHASANGWGYRCGAGRATSRRWRRPGAITNSQAPGWLNRFQARFWTGPPHPVARALQEGDEVAGFTVLETPGHSRGHVAYWRESDRVLILGDVLEQHERDDRASPACTSRRRSSRPTRARNRESARRLAALEPALACFGHGAPLRDPGKLADFVARTARA